MKKINFFQIASIAILVLLINDFANASTFNDVSSNHVNGDAIEYVKSNGIVSGYPNGDFKPDSTINRAEFTKIIVGAQFDSATIENCISKNAHAGWTYVFFPDVPKDAWFAKYICVAKMNDIIKGYPDGAFGPNKNINFSEASKIIVNAFGFKVGADAVWYKPFVEQLGLKKAIPTTIPGFDAFVSRGEMAEMVYRLKANVTTKPTLTYEALFGSNGIANNVAGNTNKTFTSKDGKLSFQYANDWICQEVISGERVDCYPSARKSEEGTGGFGPTGVPYPEISISIQNCVAKDSFGGRDYVYDNAVPGADGTAYLFVAKAFGACAVEVGFSKGIASEALGKIIFGKTANANNFASKDGKLAFSHHSDWICQEVISGERVDCYPSARKSEEGTGGFGPTGVPYPEISISIQNCVAKDSFGGRDYVYDNAVPGADGTAYLFVAKAFGACAVEVGFSKGIVTKELGNLIH